MAQKPRTPVHFPRMKIRGHRNKAKAAARFRREVLMPNVVAHLNPDGSVGIQAALGRPQLGLMTVRTVAYVDGFGRSAPHVGLYEYRLTPVRAEEVAKPKPTFSAQIRLASGMSDEVREILFGRERHGEG